jgi:lipid-A-disaccharide synthase
MIGVICGGGDYPRLVAKACVEKKIDFCLLFLNGFSSPESFDVKSVCYKRVDFGEIDKAIDFLKKNKVDKIVFAGRVKRPNFSQLSLDKKGRSWLLKLGKAIFAGDDGLLRAVANLIQEEGFEIISGADLLDDVFLPVGIFSARKPSKSDSDDIKIGLLAAKEHGVLDLGQSVIVRNGEILGKEDENGTNALIEKCGQKSKAGGGILVKISKPQQDDRLDLPTIGVETIEALHENGFDGLAVEANKCIVINKEKVIERADEVGIFIVAKKVSESFQFPSLISRSKATDQNRHPEERVARRRDPCRCFYNAILSLVRCNAVFSGSLRRSAPLDDGLGNGGLNDPSKVSTAKIFIVAGEASGDYLGGKLMEDILEISDEKVEFFGIGGQRMEKVGFKKLFSINELSIIGIFEVIGKIFHVKRLIDKTAKAICDFRPSVVVTIDSSGFTHRVAKKVKKTASKIPIVHYVAPPVWAWRPRRAKTMRDFIDKLMTLLPFEPPYFEKHGLETVFVGHPIATDRDFDKPEQSNIRNFLNSACKVKEKKDFKIITLLPGSRTSEILRHLPILKDFAELMIDKYKNVLFIIPTIESLQSKIEEATRDWSQKPIIVASKSQKVLAYYSSDAAVAASGTVTLELARVDLPFVAIYKTSAVTHRIVKFLIKVKNVCLINILAKKNVVPELLQKDCSAENIFQSVEKILNADEAEKQKKAFKEIVEVLKTDPKLAAKTVLKTSQKENYR